MGRTPRARARRASARAERHGWLAHARRDAHLARTALPDVLAPSDRPCRGSRPEALTLDRDARPAPGFNGRVGWPRRPIQRSQVWSAVRRELPRRSGRPAPVKRPAASPLQPRFTGPPTGGPFLWNPRPRGRSRAAQAGPFPLQPRRSAAPGNPPAPERSYAAANGLYHAPRGVTQRRSRRRRASVPTTYSCPTAIGPGWDTPDEHDLQSA